MSLLLLLSGRGPLPIAVQYRDIRVEYYASAAWHDITADLLAPDGEVALSIQYGIQGNGPLDNMASTGTLRLILDNSHSNSAELEGYYSRLHANTRAGWAVDAPIRVTIIGGNFEYVKFRGRVDDIRPEPGAYGTRRVYVTAYDIMRDLAETDLREIPVQIEQTEDQLFNTICDAMPTDAQPVARDFDPGLDEFPVALDDLQGGAKAMAAANRVLSSAFGGKLFSTGPGTLTYRTRHSLLAVESAFTFDNNMHDLSIPSSLARVYRKVFSTIHPKQITETPTDLLYTLPEGTTIELAPGQVYEVFTPYTDPNNRQTKVGGTEIQDNASSPSLLVPGTHYQANSLADGNGADLTANVDVTLVGFGTTAKWRFENVGMVSLFITLQKVFGRGIYDLGVQTFQSVDPGATSHDRPLTIEMPYQANALKAQSFADFTRALWSEDNQIEGVEYLANYSDEYFEQMLERDIGDAVTVSEQITGAEDVDGLIQSVSIEVTESLVFRVRYGLVPANTTPFWQIGVAGRSELGLTTRLAA